MGCRTIVAITVALACGWPIAGRTQDQPGRGASVVSAKTLTRQQFEALAPDAVIEIDGERITKRDFVARTTRAFEEAARTFQAMQARRDTIFEARRKTLLDGETAALAEANKKVEDEVNRLVSADAAAHGPGWEVRKKQAAELLHQAEKALPAERSRLEKQAADLLAPSAK